MSGTIGELYKCKLIWLSHPGESIFTVLQFSDGITEVGKASGAN